MTAKAYDALMQAALHADAGNNVVDEKCRVTLELTYSGLVVKASRLIETGQEKRRTMSQEVCIDWGTLDAAADLAGALRGFIDAGRARVNESAQQAGTA